MANSEQLYRPGETQEPLAAGEPLRYSFALGQGKKNWVGLHYELVPGVTYHCHLTNSRMILESKVRSAQGFFLQKTLVFGLSVAARAYGIRHTSAGADLVQSQLTDGQTIATAVRDQTISIPYDQISHTEKLFPGWMRVTLCNPRSDFDPDSLVFLPSPLSGRAFFKTGWSAAAEVTALFNAILRDYPRAAAVVS